MGLAKWAVAVVLVLQIGPPRQARAERGTPGSTLDAIGPRDARRRVSQAIGLGPSQAQSVPVFWRTGLAAQSRQPALSFSSDQSCWQSRVCSSSLLLPGGSPTARRRR